MRFDGFRSKFSFNEHAGRKLAKMDHRPPAPISIFTAAIKCLCNAGLVLILLAPPAFPFQTAPSESMQQLIQDVAYNEVHDRATQSCWIYHVEKTVDRQTRSEEQVESSDGPVFRVFALDGKPLTPDQTKQEDARLAHLLSDPGEQRKAAQEHEQDEVRLQRLTALMPRAFLYEPDRSEGDRITFRFSPNPNFSPPTFEARAFAGMAGTVVIDAKQKRLIRLQGQLIRPVDFGFGLLGRIEKGGTFQIDRMPVSSTHWKTTQVSVHVSGHIILFKSVSKQQDESRSNFHPLPEGTGLKQAEALLSQHVPPAL
jgi:hypothetical protein